MRQISFTDKRQPIRKPMQERRCVSVSETATSLYRLSRSLAYTAIRSVAVASVVAYCIG